MNTIDYARKLGEAIQQDEAYIKYHEADKAAQDDSVLQDLIGKFNLKKMDLNLQIQAQKRDEERIAKLQAELKEVYEAVMQNATMVALNDAKKEIDQKLAFINQIIIGSVNGEDPQKIEFSNCTSDCSTCQGCK